MEAIFLVCGAGGPQLKRNPLGCNMHVPLLIIGLLALAIAGSLAVLYSGDYLTLEEHRLPGVGWRWLDIDPEHFEPAARSKVVRLRRLLVGALVTVLIAVALLWAAFH